MKQAEACGIFVGVLRLHGRPRGGVPVPVAHRPLHAVLVIEPDVEPHRRIERGVLVQAQPGQVAIEVPGVLRRGEVAVLQAPVGDRPADAVDQLPHALLALAGVHFAVEILVGHDVGGQLRPGGGDLAIALLEDHLAPFALDRRGAQVPGDRVEGIGRVGRAEDLVDHQPGRRRPGGLGAPTARPAIWGPWGILIACGRRLGRLLGGRIARCPDVLGGLGIDEIHGGNPPSSDKSGRPYQRIYISIDIISTRSAYYPIYCILRRFGPQYTDVTGPSVPLSEMGSMTAAKVVLRP